LEGDCKYMERLSRLKRPRNPMPDFVKQALIDNNLMKQYLSRPPYQNNDYLGWINRAVRNETKQKRLNQMLAELRKGNVYMKMAYNPRVVK